MLRMAMKAFVVAALVAGGSVFGVGALIADEKPTIDEIMKKNHNKKAGLFPKIADQVKAGKLSEAAPLAKDMAVNAAKLPTVKPEKGDAKSWEKLSKAYAETAKALADACEKKDEAAAKAAAGKLGGSCKACHDAHR